MKISLSLNILCDPQTVDAANAHNLPFFMLNAWQHRSKSKLALSSGVNKTHLQNMKESHHLRGEKHFPRQLHGMIGTVSQSAYEGADRGTRSNRVEQK